MRPDRALTAVAALLGAAGIGLLALAAHGKWPTIDYAAIMALAHAPALLALAAARRAGLLHPALGLTAAVLLVLAVALFSGDVTLNALTGGHLFPMAAPTGGSLAIGAWLLLAVAALLPVPRP